MVSWGLQLYKICTQPPCLCRHSIVMFREPPFLGLCFGAGVHPFLPRSHWLIKPCSLHICRKLSKINTTKFGYVFPKNTIKLESIHRVLRQVGYYETNTTGTPAAPVEILTAVPMFKVPPNPPTGLLVWLLLYMRILWQASISNPVDFPC